MESQYGGLGWAGPALDVQPLDLSHALEAGRVAAWCWGEDTGLEWSADAADALGIPEIVLRSPDLLNQAADPRDIEVVAPAVRRAWRQGGEVKARIRGSFVAGQPRWFDIAGRVVQDDYGRPTGATGIAFEVTDEHEAGEALLDALDEAEMTLDRLLTVAGEWNSERDVVLIARQTPGLTLVEHPPGRLALGELLMRTGSGDAERVRQGLACASRRGQSFGFEILFRDDLARPRRVLLRGGPVEHGAWLTLTVLD